METILCGMNEVNSNRIKNEVENLARHKAGGMTGFQEKFKVLIGVDTTISVHLDSMTESTSMNLLRSL